MYFLILHRVFCYDLRDVIFVVLSIADSTIHRLYIYMDTYHTFYSDSLMRYNFAWYKRKYAIKVVSDWKIFNQARSLWESCTFARWLSSPFHRLFCVRTWHAVTNEKTLMLSKYTSSQISVLLCRTMNSEYHALTDREWEREKWYGTTSYLCPSRKSVQREQRSIWHY